MSVGALVDASYAGGWVAVPEGDEDPDESAAGVARELQHERKWSLRWGCVEEGQVQLRAPGEFRRVGLRRLAREEVGLA